MPYLLVQLRKIRLKKVISNKIYTDEELKVAVGKHVHKYILRNLGTDEKPRKVYACSYPDCTHFMPSKELVIGKKSICWKCAEQFVLGKDQVRFNVVKPKCLDCRKKTVSNLPHLRNKQLDTQELEASVDKLLDKFRIS